MNQDVTALDAAVFYKNEDGDPAMVCVKAKFSSKDAATRLSWADSYNWVKAMEAACAQQVGSEWNRLRGRVVYLIAARRRRGPNYEADKTAQPRRKMDQAIVLCWEDLRICLGSYFLGLLEHAETLLRAEVVQNGALQN